VLSQLSYVPLRIGFAKSLPPPEGKLDINLLPNAGTWIRTKDLSFIRAAL
jgi:hypothetical protein